MSETTIAARIRSDGTIVEVLKDGSERPFPATPMRPMTEAEIVAAAVADPDARPMTPEELRSAKRVPRTKSLRGPRPYTRRIRRALSHSARDFAGLGTGAL